MDLSQSNFLFCTNHVKTSQFFKNIRVCGRLFRIVQFCSDKTYKKSASRRADGKNETFGAIELDPKSFKRNRRGVNVCVPFAEK